MYKLNIPFVWGPIGGGEAIPDEYFQLIGKKSALIQKIRKVMMKTVSINPLIIRPLKKSKIVIARTDDTVKVIPKKYRDKVKTCLETSIDLREIQPKEYKINNINEGKISFIYTGRLINIKGIELIIRAIPNLINKDKVKLILVGDGPQKNIYKIYLKN
nr:glycosyltransferase [Thomasclavelia saccharogumia]